MAEYNRAAAFLEFSKGTTLEEISHALAIPINRLKCWHRDEAWALLAPQQANLTVTLNSDGAERARKRIEANREKNVSIISRLQEDLLEVVSKLRDGTLKTKRVFANGTSVELDPSLRDRCDLALYAKNVADASYRAIGDTEPSKNPHADSGLPHAGQITIILPPLLAAPREKVAQIVDIEAETVAIAESKEYPNTSAHPDN